MKIFIALACDCSRTRTHGRWQEMASPAEFGPRTAAASVHGQAEADQWPLQCRKRQRPQAGPRQSGSESLVKWFRRGALCPEAGLFLVAFCIWTTSPWGRAKCRRCPTPSTRRWTPKVSLYVFIKLLLKFNQPEWRKLTCD